MKKQINNKFYDILHDGWYSLNNHPVAILRAENRVRIPWIEKSIFLHFPSSCKVLDIGCGAGMLTNSLSKKGHQVSGIDLSQDSLNIAKKLDETKTVDYQYADADHLPYPDDHFEVVCAMDLLEHVNDALLVIKEASRVLKQGGLFFFHTFNKNILSYLLIIKAVEWFVPNCPKNMHVYDLFIKPKILTKMLKKVDLNVVTLLGFRLKFFQKGLIHLLLKKEITENFQFIFSKNLSTGYCGYARKG